MRCANWISSSDYSLSVITIFSRAWNNGRGCDTSFDLDELVFLPRNSSAIPGTVISGLVPVTCCPNRSLKRYELALLFLTDITQSIFFLGWSYCLDGSDRLKTMLLPPFNLHVSDGVHSSCLNRIKQLFHALWFFWAFHYPSSLSLG